MKIFTVCRCVSYQLNIFLAMAANLSWYCFIFAFALFISFVASAATSQSLLSVESFASFSNASLAFVYSVFSIRAFPIKKQALISVVVQDPSASKLIAFSQNSIVRPYCCCFRLITARFVKLVFSSSSRRTIACLNSSVELSSLTQLPLDSLLLKKSQMRMQILAAL